MYFLTRERGANAKMYTLPKREVSPGIGPRDIKVLGTLVLPRIATGRAQKKEKPGAGRDLDATDENVLRRSPLPTDDGRVVAKHFLDSILDTLRMRG